MTHDITIQSIDKIFQVSQHTMFEKIRQSPITEETKHEAIDLWIRTYDLHKAMTGSYKHLQGAEYVSKMVQRQEWRINHMYEQFPQLKK